MSSNTDSKTPQIISMLLLNFVHHKLICISDHDMFLKLASHFCTLAYLLYIICLETYSFARGLNREYMIHVRQFFLLLPCLFVLNISIQTKKRYRNIFTFLNKTNLISRWREHGNSSCFPAQVFHAVIPGPSLLTVHRSSTCVTLSVYCTVILHV